MCSDVRVDRPRIAPHMPELDGLRFVAFLAVFFFHATHVTAGGTRWAAFCDSLSFGLPLFFVLSSYLITKNLLIEREATGGISLRRFYVRRALRIWPLYLTFLLLTFLGGFVFRSLHMGAGRFIAFLLMCGNFYVGSHGFGTSPTYPLWSISIEEQFYLIWPAIVRGTARQLMLGSALIAIAATFAIYASAFFKLGTDKIWTATTTGFLFFAAGALLALWEREGFSRKNAWKGSCIIIAGFASWLPIEIWSSVRAGGESAARVTFAYVALALACSAMLIGFRLIPAACFPKPLTDMGKISYGLYVFHVLCLHYCHLPVRFGRAPSVLVALGCTCVLAKLSYTFLEKPFLRLKDWFEPGVSQPSERVGTAEVIA